MTETQKKTGSPSQPSYRSVGNRSRRRRKPTPILRRFVRFFKRSMRRWGLFLISAGLIVFFLLCCLTIPGGADENVKTPQTAAAGTTEVTTAEAQATETAATETPEPSGYIFRDGNGTPINLEGMTNAWAAEAGFEKRYTLTDAEHWEIASVVTAEAVGEPFAGKVAVAQCVLQSCEDDGIRPIEALTKYKYSPHRPEPCEEALEAVAAVFDFGYVVTAEPIKYFYAPALTTSEWHESQVYVLTINNHRFFKEADNG